MTKVQVWLLNEGVGWFRYTVYEGHAPREDIIRGARELMRGALPGLRMRTGFRPPAVAYEVVRENG